MHDISQTRSGPLPGSSGWLRRGVVAVLLAAAALAAVQLSGARAPDPSPADAAVGPPGSGNASGRGKGLVPYPLARLVPSDVLAFVSVRSVPRLLEKARRTGIARALEDPEVQPLVRGLAADFLARNVELASVLEALKSLLSGSSAHDAGGGASGEAALALLGPGPREAVLLVDTSGMERQAKELAATLEAYALLSGQVKRRGAGRSSVVTFEIAGRGEVGAWAAAGALFVAGTSSGAVQGALERAASASAGPAHDCLERAEAFRTGASRARPAAGPGAWHDYLVYVDLARAAGAFADASAGAFLRRSGLEGFGSAVLAGRIGDPDGSPVREGLYLHAPAELGGTPKLLRGPGITLSTARLVPSRALVALFVPANGPAAAELLRGDPVKAYLGSGPVQTALPGVERLLEPVARCLLPLGRPPGGPERGEACVFVWSVGRVNWLPRLGVIADVADADGFAEAWTGLARALGGRVTEHAVELPRGPGGEGERVILRAIEGMRFRVPFARSPAACVCGDRVFAAGDAAALRELLLAGEAVRGSLAGAGGRGRALERLPAERRFFFYANVPRIVDRAFEPYALALVERLTPGALERVEIGRDEMPSGQAIARHLAPAACSVMSDAEGVRLDAVTPAGLVPTIGFAALVADAFASPSPARPPQRDDALQDYEDPF